MKMLIIPLMLMSSAAHAVVTNFTLNIREGFQNDMPASVSDSVGNRYYFKAGHTDNFENYDFYNDRHRNLSISTSFTIPEIKTRFGINMHRGYNTKKYDRDPMMNLSATNIYEISSTSYIRSSLVVSYTGRIRHTPCYGDLQTQQSAGALDCLTLNPYNGSRNRPAEWDVERANIEVVKLFDVKRNMLPQSIRNYFDL